ncbi:MAG: hypothetical protein ACREC8_06750, partial [Limisphaerales bacterium]
MIFNYLIPKLEENFPNRGLRIETAPVKRIVFPAAHSDFGDIEIHDDGDEVTIYAGNFTHGHFSNYDENLSEEQKAEKISAEVVKLLKDVFADKVVFWGSHTAGGGWGARENPEKLKPFFKSLGSRNKEYVWSGP